MSAETLKLPTKGKTPQANWRFFAEKRINKGMSQKEVGDLCGVNQSQVSDWERGESAPQTKHLVTIAHAFGVPVEHLLREVDIFFYNRNS